MKHRGDGLVEEELRLFRAVVDASSEAISISDSEGALLYLNPAHVELLGGAIGEDSGADAVKPVPSESLEILRHEIRPSLEATGSWQGEYDMLDRKGRRVTLFRRSGVLRDHEGRITHTFSFRHDISERKLREKELEGYRGQLEELVKERTGELQRRVEDVERLNAAMLNIAEDLQASNRQLDLVVDQLESANRELGSFSYSVSHDLRAPLRHINGFVKLLVRREEGKLDAISARYLGIVAVSAVRMGALIDDLLVLSRLGRVEMRPAVVDMGEIVGLARLELRSSVGDRDVVWKVAEMPSVLADRGLLRQLFSNLLGNAVKYTATRERARIEVGALETSDRRVTVFVRDNGVGFDMEHAGRLFGVFQRLHGEDEFEGTGIGLATAQRIVARHEGEIWAEAAPDEGATFFFTLPAACEAEETAGGLS